MILVYRVNLINYVDKLIYYSIIKHLHFAYIDMKIGTLFKPRKLAQKKKYDILHHCKTNIIFARFIYIRQG